MVKLYDKASGAPLGTLTDEQLQFLVDQLEEESSGDDDYYFNQDTLDMLRDAGASPDLLGVLQGALGARGEVEIRWSRE